MMGPEKVCGTCGKVKPISEFPPRKAGRGESLGVDSRCRSCHRERTAAFRLEQPEKYRATKKRFRKAHGKAIALQWKNYYKTHKAEIRRRCAEYYRTEEGKAVKRRIRQRRRAAKLGGLAVPADRILTVAQWEDILKIQRGRCHWCRQKMKKPTLDHVIPLTKRGLHVAENIVAACGPCNSRKRDKIVTLF